MKLGIFDSGVGGMTVLQKLRASFAADFYYFGDTANVPYGSKSPAQIKVLAKNAAEYLKAQKIDAMVVACNTASCLALDQIRLIMGKVPVFGVVDAGVQAVKEAVGQQSPGKVTNILVVGTK